MVWEKIKDALLGREKKSSKKDFAKGVAGGAAIAGLVATAKRMHEKGYDEKAIKMLKDSSEKLKEEAENLKARIKQKKKPSEEKMDELKSKVPRKTKDEIKEFAKEEYGVELSTNDLKDEMIEQFFDELESR